MQHLPLPVDAAHDEAEIETLAKKPEWAVHKNTWLAAYQKYRANGGSPFAITHEDFGDTVIGARQYALYDSRKGSGELRRMRLKRGLKCCPVCGSPVTGDLDHYLPRSPFPEFAIMRANLIPACTHCNSGVKGGTINGVSPRRFIHPYFDTWAGNALWFVEILPPYKAARFKARPLAGLTAPRDEIVAFHLENVLGDQFARSMERDWSALPVEIKFRDTELTTASITTWLTDELRIAIYSGTTNCWRAALLRGVNQDPHAIAYLRQQAQAAQLPDPL